MVPDTFTPVGGSTSAPRVVLVASTLVLRMGVSRLLVMGGNRIVKTGPGFGHLAECVDGHDPDIVVVCPTVDEIDSGLAELGRLRRKGSGMSTLVLAPDVPADLAPLLSGRGGIGWARLSRIGSARRFNSMVARVRGGGTEIGADVLAQWAGRRTDPSAELTGKEQRTLKLVAEGLSNTAIAERMSVSRPSVEKYVASVFVKLRLEPDPRIHRRVRAASMYWRGGDRCP